MTEPREGNGGENVPEETSAEEGAREDAEEGASIDVAESEESAEDRARAAEIEQLREEAGTLRTQLSERTAQLRTVSKAYTDLQAEQKAFRERVEHRAGVRAERRAAELVETFFDPVQNLKRSLSSATDPEDGLVVGLKMVLHQFLEALRKLGLTEVPGEGAIFDPKMHEALAMMPVTDPEQDGRVLVVHTSGYAIGDKTLQPAQVVIGKYEPSVDEEGEEPAIEDEEKTAAEG